jgi:hypothetical protein
MRHRFGSVLGGCCAETLVQHLVLEVFLEGIVQNHWFSFGSSSNFKFEGVVHNQR